MSARRRVALRCRVSASPLAGLLGGVVTGLLVAALAGCAPSGLRVDATSIPGAQTGTVPATSAATTAPTPPTPPAGTTAAQLPSMRTLDARATILADTSVPAELREPVATQCVECGVYGAAYADVTGDARDEAIYTISDGTAVAGTLVYTMTTAGPKRAFAHVGRQGWVEVVAGNLEVTRQMYAADDQWCCPSGPPEVSSYTWNGTAFALVRRTGGGVGFSSFDPKDRVIL